MALDCGGGLLTQADVSGFRAPGLAFSDWTWQALDAMNFQYDCSAGEIIGGDPFSTNFGQKMWPYTMDAGFAGPCFSGTCSYKGKYPGLWNIPMNTIDEIDTTKSTYRQPIGNNPMDPPLSTAADLDKYYGGNFNLTYNGNRAPFGIWLHPPWLIENPARVQWLNDFLARILSMPDVWVVSGQDVVSYMKNPVPAGSTTPPFKCAGVGNAPAPSSGTAPTGNPPAPSQPVPQPSPVAPQPSPVAPQPSQAQPSKTSPPPSKAAPSPKGAPTTNGAPTQPSNVNQPSQAQQPTGAAPSDAPSQLSPSGNPIDNIGSAAPSTNSGINAILAAAGLVLLMLL